MKNKLLMVFVSCVLLVSSLRADRAQFTLPPKWSKKVLSGITNASLELDKYKQSAKIDFFNHYLNGGLYPNGWSMNWGHWDGTPGEYIIPQIQEATKYDIMPTYTYYQIVHTEPWEGDERVNDLKHINDASIMVKYWEDLSFFFKAAGQLPDQEIVLHIEPDFWGFAQQEGFDTNTDWTTLPAKVGGSGFADVAGLPDTIDGYARGIKALRDKYAPNVILAYHCSFWTSGINKMYRDATDAELLAGGQQSADLFNQLTPVFDMIFIEVSDGDSVYDGQTLDTTKLWEDKDHENFAKYVHSITDNTHKPIIIWQIATGNSVMRSVNNTNKHYQSTFVQTYLGGDWENVMTRNLDAGIVGYMFSAESYATWCTRTNDYAGDGVTNPTPINGNDTFASILEDGAKAYFDDSTNTLYSPYAADDDGGLFRWRNYTYHEEGPLAITSASDIKVCNKEGLPIYNGSTEISEELNTDFGVAMVNTSKSDRTFYIRNLGTTDLLIGSVSISGASASDFAVLINPSTSIPPGEASEFTVRFIPTSSGDNSATVTVSTNDPDKGSYTFAIRGYGSPQNFKPTDISECSLWVDASQISNHNDGDRVDVWNDLSGNNNNLSKEAEDPADAIGAVYKTNAINGHSVLRFNVDASYQMATPLTDIRTVFWVLKEDAGYTGDADGTANLLGDEFNNYDFLRGDNGEIWNIDLTPNNVKFGETRINGTLVDGNTTKVPNDFSVISLTTRDGEPARAQRVQRDRKNNRLWKGDWGELIIYNKTLTPDERESVEIYLQDKWLNAYSKQPEIRVRGNDTEITNGDTTPSTEDNTDLGTAYIGIGKTVTYTIVNTGTGQLDLNGVTLSGPDAAEFSIARQPASSVDFGSETSFDIKFFPSSTGEKSATVTISSNDPVSGTFTFDLAVDALAAHVGDGPAGTSNCILWFDAADVDGDGQREGLLEDGVDVSTGAITFWYDKSQYGHDGTQEDTKTVPTLQENSFNGMSTAAFDGNCFLQFPSLASIRTVFWVVKETDYSGAHFFLGDSDTSDFHRGIDGGYAPDGKIWDDVYSSENVRNGQTFLDRTSVDGTATQFPTGDYHILSLVTAGTVTANHFTLDRYNENRSWKGNIAEVIIYNQPLTDPEREKVEAYLHDKWFSSQDSYTLTVNEGTGSGTYAYNDSVSISATIPTDAVFDMWTGDIQYLDDIYSPDVTFNMPANDMTLTATFKQTAPNTYSISGDITGDDVQGVTVSIDSEHSASTDANGHYSIINVTNGTYTVTPSKGGYIFNPGDKPVTVSGQDVAGVDFTSRKFTPSDDVPTSISGCVLWLDGADPNGDGSKPTGSLSAWIDKSSTGNNANQTEVAQQATVISDGLNGRSVISFDGVDDTYSFNKISNIRSVFWVLKETDINELHFLLGDDTSFDFHRAVDENGNPTGALWDDEYAASGILSGDTYLNKTLMASSTNDVMPVGQYNIVSLVTSENVVASQLTEDRENGRSWKGEIAEIIIYNQQLSDTDRQTVENYLYNKWFVANATYNISGQITGDDVAGVTVTAGGYSAETNSSGQYIIVGVPKGNYEVTPTKDGYSFSPSSTSVEVVDADVKDVNFTSTSNQPKEYTLIVNYGTGGGTYFADDVVSISADVPSGQVFDSWIGDTQYIADNAQPVTTVTMPKADITLTATFKTAPPDSFSVSGKITGDILEGVTVSIDQSFSSVSGSDGTYTISGVTGGTYTVTPMLDGYTFEPVNRSVTVSDADITGIDFIATQNTQTQYTLTVNNGSGSGSYAEGANIQIAATIPSGKEFDSWSGDTQYIADVNSANTTVTMPATDVTVTANFKDPAVSTYSISGTVTGDITQGVTVTAGGKSDVTNAGGAYTIAGLQNGTYTVTPILDGYTFSPANQSVTINGSDQTGIHFTAAENTGGGGGGVSDPLEISGCNLWLDGADPKGDGSVVTGALDGWVNKADSANVAYQINDDQKAEVVDNALNGLSVINFQDGNRYYPIVNADETETMVNISVNTVFWVVKGNETLTGDSPCPFLLGHSSVDNVSDFPFHSGLDAAYNYDGKIWDDQYAAPEVRNGQTYLDTANIDGTQTDFPRDNNYHILSVVLTGQVNIDQITLDRNNPNRSWQGDIAEIITYNSALSDADRQSVEAYLNAKWFGINPPPSDTYSITGTITGTIKEGVTVTAGTKSDLTDADGNYEIKGLSDGTYTVKPILSGYSFEPETKSVTISSADQSEVDFVSTQEAPTQYTLTVNNGTGSGLYDAGISVNISAQVPAGKVFHVWTGDTAGIADVNAALTTLTMPASNVTVTATFTDAPADSHNIIGQIVDANNNGINGVTVSIDATHSAVTDSNGNYTISGVVDGAYTLIPSKSGYTFNPSSTQVTVAGSDVTTGTKFTGAPVTGDTHNITGKITDNNGVGVSGVTVSIDATHSAVTDVNGNYTISGVVDGTYTLTPSKSGYTFSPSSTQVVVAGSDVSAGTEFTASPTTPPGTYTISGIIKDADGSGLANVTVSADSYTAKTDASGAFTIIGVAPGAYNVVASLEDYAFKPSVIPVAITSGNAVNVNFTGSEGGIPETVNPPVAVEDTYYIQQNGTLTVQPVSGVLSNDVNVEDTTMTAVLDSTVSHGTLSNFGPNGGFTYTPDGGFIGDDEFTYHANNEKANSDVVTVIIHVISGTTAPATAVGDAYEVVQGGILIVEPNGVLANDLNASNLTATVTKPVSDGKLTLNSDGSFEYEASEKSSGVVTFTYKINGTDSTAIVTINVTPVKITIGSLMSFNASEVDDLDGDEFAKAPKLYGIINGGKKGSLKKIKDSTGAEFSGVWSKKYTLYDKKALKGGYESYFDIHGALGSVQIMIKAKGKTADKTKIDSEIYPVQLVPPVITAITDGKKVITKSSASSTITIEGKYFGEKAPKVALEVNGKLLKCKVDKSGLTFTNYKGKQSAMDPVTGESTIKVILPKDKKLPPGPYPIVLDNKIGIATTPETSEVKGKLPVIIIE